MAVKFVMFPKKLNKQTPIPKVELRFRGQAQVPLKKTFYWYVLSADQEAGFDYVYLLCIFSFFCCCCSCTFICPYFVICYTNTLYCITSSQLIGQNFLLFLFCSLSLTNSELICHLLLFTSRPLLFFIVLLNWSPLCVRLIQTFFTCQLMICPASYCSQNQNNLQTLASSV